MSEYFEYSMRHVPTTLYIDTNIFKQHGLRFDTKEFSRLQEIFVREGLRLLVPEIMEKELERLFKKDASEAVKALVKARNEYSIRLLKLDELPTKADLEARSRNEMMKKWEDFKKHFVVEELPLVGNFDDVIDWYFEIRPPFAKGKKEKEFPDAFIISVLDQYHKKHNASIAVISLDGDFRKACEMRRYIDHYLKLGDYIDAFEPEFDIKDLELPEIDPIIPITTEDLTVLKEILGRGNNPTPIEISRVMKLLESRGTNYDYFFRHAKGDVWLKHLMCNGYFENPPDAEITEDGRRWAPEWLPIYYLVRVFDSKPDEVIELILKLPETSNPRILQAIVDITLKASTAEVVNLLSSKILSFVDHEGIGHG